MAIARTLQLRRTRLEWLARRIALSGCLSRREALAAIERGDVKVDGRTITRDVEICDEAEVSLMGRVLPAAAAKPFLFGMLKPPGVGCTYTLNASGPTLKTLLLQQPCLEEMCLDDIVKQTKTSAFNSKGISSTKQQDAENSRKRTAANATSRDAAQTPEEQYSQIPSSRGSSSSNSSSSGSSGSSSSSDAFPHIPGHLIPVNRLPLHAEGLVLLTNDGDFAHTLRKPSSKILSAYDLRVSGCLPDGAVWRQWACGVQQKGIDYGRVWVQMLRPCPSGAWLRLKLVEPPGADLRSLLLGCGLKIRRMRLYSFGPYLSSSVPPGILLPLRLHPALLQLLQQQQQRPRMMLVPAAEELQNIVEATQQMKTEKGGGFPAQQLLKATSVIGSSIKTKHG